jgi:NAD(P)-dependent dehydrogenase (short-subunit alcohol dehydrogenase family)
MTRLEGKAAFVTGAGGGIGRAIALAMAREGAVVGLADIDAALLDEALAEGQGLALHAMPCDVADRGALKSAVDGFVEKTGGLDILVNNAVRFHFAPMEGFDPEIASSMLDVGLKGVYWGLQAATPHLAKRGGGSVINLSSIAVRMALPNASVYSSIKGAIDALTRQQAGELGPKGIRVNALAPGSVPTPGANSVIDQQGWENRAKKSLLGILPTAEDLANGAVFLASDDARAITGITLVIDAGMTITGP